MTIPMKPHTDEVVSTHSYTSYFYDFAIYLIWCYYTYGSTYIHTVGMGQACL